ncbi:MAG: hypothetical protein A3K09_07890 [Nitrospinae bacterium RIFCSPLOWO2_12_FULL_47_7]|nr:MAG: hypothetical protein A3K09_07890 [Nitrospinae bacterium RIFCSPLOWO2_12_FULL_47_7]
MPSSLRATLSALIFLLLLFPACVDSQAERLIQKANSEWVKGRNHSAIEIFKSVLEKFPNGPHTEEALFRLGEIYYFGLGDSSQATVYFLEVLQLAKQGHFSYDAQKHIAEIIEYSAKDYDQAIIEYQKLISDFKRTEDENAEHQFRIALLYLKKQNYEQAIVELELLLERYPKNSWVEEAEFRRMEILYTLNRCADADNRYADFAKKYTQSRFMNEMEFVKAACLEEEGKLNEALALFKKLEGKYKYPPLLAMKIEGIERRIKKVR